MFDNNEFCLIVDKITKMDFSNKIKEANLKKILSTIDLTSLSNNDTEEDIIALCSKAITKYGNVAAVCVLPKFIKIAKKNFSNLHAGIKVATVVNFPKGRSDAKKIIREIEAVIKDDVDEIDLVMPYGSYLKGELKTAETILRKSKEICLGKTLKIILETGVYKKAEIVYFVSNFVCKTCEPAFIKTSTGKYKIGATVEAGAAMLLSIRDNNLTEKVGVKFSGGVKKANEALKYLMLAKEINGNKWMFNKKNIRFGASSLLDDVLYNLSKI